MSLDMQPDPVDVLAAARSLCPFAPIQSTGPEDFKKRLQAAYPKGWVYLMLEVLAAYISYLSERCIMEAALIPGLVPANYGFEAEREALLGLAMQARDEAVIAYTQREKLLQIRQRCIKVYEFALPIMSAISIGDWTVENMKKMKEEEKNGKA